MQNGGSIESAPTSTALNSGEEIEEDKSENTNTYEVSDTDQNLDKGKGDSEVSEDDFNNPDGEK